MRFVPIFMLFVLSCNSQTKHLGEFQSIIESTNFDSLIEKEISIINDETIYINAKNHSTSIQSLNYVNAWINTKEMFSISEKYNELRFYEFYDWHSLYHFFYLVVILENGDTYFRKIDNNGSNTYPLIKISEDYFIDLLNVLNTVFNLGDGSSYISLFTIDKKGIRDFKYFGHANFIEHQPFFIAEKIILQEKK